MALALAAGATFVSRTFAGDTKHMVRVLQKAIEHPGYAIVDCLQPCVTYNKINTYEWYRGRVYKLEEEEGYDPSSRDAAWEKAKEWGDRIPIGILYQGGDRPTYEEQVSALKSGPLVGQPMNGRYRDYEALKLEFV
jgi:2-oxoglutarate ferredoxin oxidoreductase subunit beta